MLRDEEGLTNRGSDILSLGDEVVVLGDRQRDPCDIRLLKCFGPDEGGSNLACNANDRRGVHHGRRDTRDHVGGAWARCRNGNAHAPARTSVSVRHMGGTLLVASQDMANRELRQCIVSRQNGSARISEHGGYTLSNQRFPDSLCSSALHECLISHDRSTGNRPALRHLSVPHGKRPSSQKRMMAF